jgi:uncharacterized membrane protein YkvA (DUF1232 family)
VAVARKARKNGTRNVSGGVPRNGSRNAAGNDPRDDADDDVNVEREPRTGTKKAVGAYIAQLPRFLKLLWGLIRDPRVAGFDKLLVAGAVAYIISPIDYIPDFIPFLGEVDDLFVLMLAIRRLIENAGRQVLLSHWTGDPAELKDFNVQKVLVAAAFFLPRRLRRRLRALGR